MEGRELPVRDVDSAARVVKALGKHRYVAGRLHLVHAFALAALDFVPELAGAVAWAKDVLANPDVDKASRDERLLRSATEDELSHVLAAFWGDGDAAARAKEALRAQLRGAEIEVPDRAPFDEEAEEETFPILIDAGWELLPLGELDPERHKGAIAAFGEPIAFASAVFEEESLLEPAPHLQELSAMGPAELLRGSEAGALASPLVVWTSGPDAYHDYVLRGVLRAAKVEGDLG